MDYSVGLGRGSGDDYRAVSEKCPRPLTHYASSNHVDEVLQSLAGIEIYPFACRVHISQAPVFLALNPYQIFMIRMRLFGRAGFGQKSNSGSIHLNGGR
jgi:hypothetical protein